MAPTKTGTNDGEENSPRSRSVKEPLLEEGGRPLSPAASSASNHIGSDHVGLDNGDDGGYRGGLCDTHAATR